MSCLFWNIKDIRRHTYRRKLKWYMSHSRLLYSALSKLFLVVPPCSLRSLASFQREPSAVLFYCQIHDEASHEICILRSALRFGSRNQGKVSERDTTLYNLLSFIAFSPFERCENINNNNNAIILKILQLAIT